MCGGGEVGLKQPHCFFIPKVTCSSDTVQDGSQWPEPPTQGTPFSPFLRSEHIQFLPAGGIRSHRRLSLNKQTDYDDPEVHKRKVRGYSCSFKFSSRKTSFQTGLGRATWVAIKKIIRSDNRME